MKTLGTGCKSSGSFELGQGAKGYDQLFVNAAKAAVGHDCDHVARAKFSAQALHDLVDIRDREGRFVLCSDVIDQFCRVEDASHLGSSLSVEYASDDHIISRAECIYVVILECRMTRGPRSWLEDRDDATVFVPEPQGGERFANGGRMMREIIDDGDAVYLAANFATATDAFEGGEGFSDRWALNSPGVSGDDNGKRVKHIERSN